MRSKPAAYSSPWANSTHSYSSSLENQLNFGTRNGRIMHTVVSYKLYQRLVSVVKATLWAGGDAPLPAIPLLVFELSRTAPTAFGSAPNEAPRMTPPLLAWLASAARIPKAQ